MILARLLQLVWHRCDKAFVFIIKKTERRKAKDTSDRTLHHWQLAISLGFMIAFGSLALWTGIGEYQVRSQLDGELILPVMDWRAIYGDGAACDGSAVVGLSCPAHPQNPALWNSPRHRGASESHPISQEHRDNIRQSPAGTYWIGITINKDLMQKALQKKANWILLGWVRGDYRVFIDGLEIMQGQESDRLGIHFPLPMNRLLEGNPLHIGIRIENLSGTGFPDVLERGRERFATSDDMRTAQRALITTAESRPLAIGFLNTTIAVFFFVLWCISKRRHEFIYTSIYILIHAGIQLSLIDVVYKKFGLQIVELADISLRVFEGGTGLLLALAYIRSSSVLIKIIAITSALFALVATISASVWGIVGVTNAYIGSHFVPFCYILGSFGCFATGRRLTLEPPGHSIPSRIRRLYYVAFCFFFMAVCYWYQSQFITQLSLSMGYRLLHVALVVLVTLVLLLDVAEQDNIIHALPIPKWHRQVPMPTEISVMITKADIKGSQEIREQLGDKVYWETLDAWYTALGEEIFKKSGEITFDEGDSIIGVINTNNSALEDMLCVHAGAYLRMNQFMKRFGLKSLAYRAAIADGTIQPVWKTMLEIRRPAFTGSVLIEVGALMEAERHFQNDTSVSRVVMPCAFKDLLCPEIRNKMFWESQMDTIKDKRGVERLVAVWRIDTASSLELLGRQRNSKNDSAFQKVS